MFLCVSFSWASFKILSLYLFFSSLNMMCLGVGFVFCFKEFILLLFSFGFNPAWGSLSFLDLLYFWKISAISSSNISPTPFSLFLLLVGKLCLPQVKQSAHVPCPVWGWWELSTFRFQATCYACNLSLLVGWRKVVILLFIWIFIFIVRVEETLASLLRPRWQQDSEPL